MTGYADPELLIAAWLRDAVGVQVWVDPDLPDGHFWSAPFAHMLRGAGLGEMPLTLDNVLLDVDVYAATADHARDAASRIWSAFVLDLPLHTFGSGVFVKATYAPTPPRWRSDPQRGRFLRSATYRAVLHSLV